MGGSFLTVLLDHSIFEIHSENCHIVLADPGFLREDANPGGWCANLLFGKTC